MMAGLAVNVNHVATIREARQVIYPDPIAAAVLAEIAGADGIVVHLRSDRRHIQDRDIRIQITTEGGIDLVIHKTTVTDTIGTLQNSGIPVSVFIDPDPEQLKLAHQCNADLVEIYTDTFCKATTTGKKEQAFLKIVDTVKLAHKLKLGVNAGHGLNYNTIKAFRGLKEINEFSIGHSIVARAVMVGMEKAVKEMLALIKTL
jgi:pyridoxine 5-phosphate synthase